MKLRLDKYLADMEQGTRSDIKKAVTKGMALVNGSVVKKPEMKIDISQDTVTYKGIIIPYFTFEYYMLNKPSGVISASSDKRAETVIDLIENRRRGDLFPVGRLDRDTEGLLLITNDGALAHRLLSPKKHVDKVYFAKIDGAVTVEDVEAFAQGIDIGDEKPALPARLQILNCGTVSEIQVTVQEGRYHQVKRMFEAVGKEVIYLKRLKMGNLVLDPSLAPGEYKEMTKEEIETLC